MGNTNYLHFFTATILNWNSVLEGDEFKEIIIDALKYRVVKGQVIVYGFIIMPNHIHVLWQIDHAINRDEFQRDFLKYTAKEILFLLRKGNRIPMLEKLFVAASDRKYQVWERNSLSVEIYSNEVFFQKLKYIHFNPCQPKWELVPHPEEYSFSSALFYEKGIDEFKILTLYMPY